ncbi:enoyl-CoA hydratase-related protein [Candidatus Aminicenantes bacterium AC-708-M15]|nr:enoyl-CoA hydratase-related protein [SCandidatus Aminicenantes bacterium Aminicenantia_JdfR_composite]MCP2598154.1 enoyl-CoA hydratase-related protein [Candidatus Aminicenantes bacterium AC-335-L06]MCP2598912.1 enoyl-CoA hydratase-related protein [Candidatus Aminicenantes bacterium AC-335-B20]MCP2603856.1 enoyl-CoA hydratase-related protein [Candidatus Aminicenantes bacterium AC-708-M15]MCP2605637.1 enoyl-CoA hydratase-related protein [Candidatus Aminicenantes bacterium AC-335-O07]MCP261805
MEFKNLLFKQEEGIGFVTINRPDKLNALNIETIKELEELFTHLKENQEIKVVIITGAGEKAFVAGADIEELSKLNMVEGKEYSLRGQRVFSLIENLGKPVIAGVNGYALGGGTELTLACHIRIASEKAMFGQPEVKLGLIPGYGGTQRLARLVGKGKALELILTGDMITAQQALEIGLVNKVVPPEELLSACKDIAKKIINNSPIAVKYALEAVNNGLDKSLEEGLDIEAELFGMVCGTEDSKEGTKAFLEKRKPVFKGK